MEHSGDDGFRHIPFRLYSPELTTKPYLQFLIKPTENEKNTTLGDLLLKANLKAETKGSYFTFFFFYVSFFLPYSCINYY